VTEQTLDHVPFVKFLGIELDEVAEGEAVGSLDLTDRHYSNPDSGIAHGGVPFSLADTVGGVAATTLSSGPAPTINMRMDYLRPTVGDTLRASAEVVRNGTAISTVDVELSTDDGSRVAVARGTFKTEGGTDESPWLVGRGVMPTDAEDEPRS
jgi:uncharacterized protein (TIGR00369 family)